MRRAPLTAPCVPLQDFVRLKKVQSYKQRKIEEEEKRIAELEAQGISVAAPSILDKPKDADDLFS